MLCHVLTGLRALGILAQDGVTNPLYSQRDSVDVQNDGGAPSASGSYAYADM